MKRDRLEISHPHIYTPTHEIEKKTRNTKCKKLVRDLSAIWFYRKSNKTRVNICWEMIYLRHTEFGFGARSQQPFGSASLTDWNIGLFQFHYYRPKPSACKIYTTQYTHTLRSVVLTLTVRSLRLAAMCCCAERDTMRASKPPLLYISHVSSDSMLFHFTHPPAAKHIYPSIFAYACCIAAE